MIKSKRDDINNPTAGLLIYQTDNNEGFYYYNGSTWLALNEDGDSDTSNELELPQSPNLGEMAYWNGSNWAVIATGNEGATLQMKDGVPTWVGGIDTTTPPEIGELYGGGVVFYIAPTPTDLDGDGDLDTGLICSIEDLGGITWNKNSNNKKTNATFTGIGKGNTNTDLIIAARGGAADNYYAAGLARNYRGGGFDDWFLPSNGELIEMFLNKADIDSGGNELHVSDYYWSSTEWSLNSAYIQRSTDVSPTANGKSLSSKVRAIRAF
jgi:hypothetical protein